MSDAHSDHVLYRLLPFKNSHLRVPATAGVRSSVWMTP